jgi:hypothetical protein
MSSDAGSPGVNLGVPSINLGSSPIDLGASAPSTDAFVKNELASRGI